MSGNKSVSTVLLSLAIIVAVGLSVGIGLGLGFGGGEDSAPGGRSPAYPLAWAGL